VTRRDKISVTPTRRIAFDPSIRGSGSCIFCQIVSGKSHSDVVYEDEKYVAFLDIFPFSKGHTLVCPKEHGETIWDMEEKDIAGLFRVASKVSRAVVAAVGADGFRFVQNNGEAANQVVAHVHVHVIPVKLEDKGKFTDRKKFTQKEMEETARAIRAEMDLA
jgi:histidine triad (HIT) family protein